MVVQHLSRSVLYSMVGARRKYLYLICICCPPNFRGCKLELLQKYIQATYTLYHTTLYTMTIYTAPTSCFNQSLVFHRHANRLRCWVSHTCESTTID
ncbi:hypothetical protein GDO81_009367 [Engystomops pustulosus]|uniref:Uncharacterized protein n=1 Tax=Engystomops pustulosus TaxID=76066 RepID=A0AAV7BQB4_ENGPU|nr:hypothetical protein GDO81_009367 [Engystomops pustulosus]